MPIIRIVPENKHKIHFITCTIKYWFNLFESFNRWEILYESLTYCQKIKGLKIYAYVFMHNHIHLICQSSDLIRFICDFKKYSS